MSYLSEVTVKISQDGEKFKGHVFASGEHIVTSKCKTRDGAIGKALSEARDSLGIDNIRKEKFPDQAEAVPAQTRPAAAHRKDSRSG